METNDAEDVVVVIGFNVVMEKEDPAGEIRLMAETFKNGDPTFAGPLTDVTLGLKTYHILELKEFVPPEVWEEQLNFKEEFEFSKEQKTLIFEALKEIRES
jgi:betaine reductase